MSKNLLDTKTVTFGEVIANGKTYKVPFYQRDYSWLEENWEDLWLDIETISNDSEENHYMGAIVLKDEGEKGEKKYTIIDGQQRIATLSLLILAVVKSLQSLIDAGIDKEQNEERKKIIKNTFLGSKDATSLTYSSKLTLNENNRDFYQTYLLQLKIPVSRRKLNDSDQLMLSAFEYFLKKLESNDKLCSSGEELSRFAEKIVAGRLHFIQITVDDELKAYTVFETLNARGLELTSTDLLKNYLFSQVGSEIDIQNIKTQWHSIANTVGIQHFPEFLRYFINSRQRLIRKDRLFKEIKSKVKTKEGVFDLLDKLEHYADIFVALDDYEDDLWKNSMEVRDLIKELSLFKIKQHKPLLMIAYFSLEPIEFPKVLRIIRALVFRYNIIGGFNPNLWEETCNKASIKIFKEEITSATQLFQELKPLYLSDGDFKNNFALKSFDTEDSRTRKIVKYILFSLENQKCQKNYPPDSQDATIEHVLPENMTIEWEASFDREKHESFVYRLGNMCLLEDKLNAREASNNVFSNKKVVYGKSQYGLTTDMRKYEEWTENEIRSRQQELANIAATVWKADY
ncbi:MAG: DUF262 domain-containing HNH endonuclease family protein [Victivallales bacterium]